MVVNHPSKDAILGNQYGSTGCCMCEPIWVKLMVIELSSEFFMEWTEYSKGGGLHIGISFVAARWAIQRKWVYSSPIYVVT